MKKYILSLIILVLVTGFTSSDKKIKIFIAGDSTAQTYKVERDGLIKGWGQMLPEFLDDNVEVVNHAMGGRSTKTSPWLPKRWNEQSGSLKRVLVIAF